jgi:hypothetical protein
VPGLHGKHAAEPATAKVPGVQGEQAAAPGAALVSAGQIVHAPLELAPTPAEAVPAGQARHAVALACGP